MIFLWLHQNNGERRRLVTEQTIGHEVMTTPFSFASEQPGFVVAGGKIWDVQMHSGHGGWDERETEGAVALASGIEEL